MISFPYVGIGAGATKLLRENNISDDILFQILLSKEFLASLLGIFIAVIITFLLNRNRNEKEVAKKKLFFIYRFIPMFNNWRLPKSLNRYLDEWLAIDKRKDKSWSARDFRFWLYLRLNDKMAKFWGSRK